jgi:hypothetical protein
MSYQITLSDVTYRSLAAEAQRLNASPDALAERYLREHISECQSRGHWRAAMKELFARVQMRLPDMPSEEIEADITAARAEVKELRRARRRSD